MHPNHLLIVLCCVALEFIICVSFFDTRDGYSIENKSLDQDTVIIETLKIPDKQIDLKNLSDSTTTLDKIPIVQLTEISKEPESINEVTNEPNQNLSTLENINDTKLDISMLDLPRINKRWYGLDIYSAAELKQSSSSSPNVRAINPPDVTLAVGKDHVMQLVHSAVQIWNKSGTSFKKISLHDFFNVSKNNYITDPVILYDNSSGNWFATMVDGGKEKMENGSSYPTCLPSGCKVIVAVSNYDDPRRTWSLYPINATKFGYFPDLPKISVSKFNLLMSTIEFQVYPVLDDLKSLPKTYMIDKNLLNSRNPTMNINYMEPDYPDYPIPFINPSKCSSTASLFKENSSDTYSPVSKIRITDYCNPTDMGSYISREILIPRLYAAPVFKQPLLNDLNGEENRKYELTILSAIRNETSVWIGLHSACQPVLVSNNSCVNILRIDKINRTGNVRTPSAYDYNLTENTQFHIDNTDVYYPAIGISKAGKLFFISGFSNSTIFPSLMASYLVSENKTEDRYLIFGSNINNSTIYGDYFGSAIDPIDGSVWVSGQYVDASIPVPDNFPSDELRRTRDRTWSTIIANIS
jgi:hypothetical protein